MGSSRTRTLVGPRTSTSSVEPTSASSVEPFNLAFWRQRGATKERQLMPLRRLILGFLVRFAVVFGLLILPWPGWNQFYGQGFRTLGNAVFGREDEKCILYFAAHRQTRGFSAVDTRITIGNRHLVDSNGKGPVAL